MTIPLARLLEAFLFGVRPWDWLDYAGALLVIAVTALLAPVGPARRAARIQPNHALREQ